MAWRIDEHVLRGEIDNRTRGCVKGRVWLAGVAEPIVLDLEGDCHPDLAGCLLHFENPSPVPLTSRPPSLQQKGTAGDITAARKVRVFDIPVAEAYMMCKRGEKPPEHMANCLYLEWFSDFSGRVVIESVEYRLQISEPTWRFSAEELAERDRRAQAGSSAFATLIDADGNATEWDEFRNEQFLREGEMRDEKYRRLIEQYADHPDGERLVAVEMGWDWVVEALDAEEAAQAEAGDSAAASGDSAAADDEDDDPFEMPPPDPLREGIDWVRDKNGHIAHPICQRAKDDLYALYDELRAAGLDDCDDPALNKFQDEYQCLTAKLAGALNGLARGGYRPGPGHIIARLKRVLEYHNQTLLAANALTGNPLIPAEQLAAHQAELFGIREDILALINRLRG